jgi:hypothetical protein
MRYENLTTPPPQEKLGVEYQRRYVIYFMFEFGKTVCSIILARSRGFISHFLSLPTNSTNTHAPEYLAMYESFKAKVMNINTVVRGSFVHFSSSSPPCSLDF